MTKKYYNIKKASAERGEIYIYGDIISEDWRWDHDTSAVSFREELAALEDVEVIDLHINSGGGDVFEAAAIYNMLKRHKARIEVHVDGLAASAASVIAMAGDKITMPRNSMMMIHNMWTIIMGNHNDLRKAADEAEKISNSTVKQAYLNRNPDLDEQKLTQMLDDETWLTADEALDLGLIDEVVTAAPVAASLSKNMAARYNNVPSELIGEKKKDLTVNIEMSDELKAAFADLKNQIEELKSNQKEKEPEQQHVAAKKRGFFF